MPQGSQAAADTLTKGRLGKGLAGLDSEGLGCQICGAEVLGCLHPKKIAVDGQGSGAWCRYSQLMFT